VTRGGSNSNIKRRKAFIVPKQHTLGVLHSCPVAVGKNGTCTAAGMNYGPSGSEAQQQNKERLRFFVKKRDF
jgi:hypothetical protein